MQKTILPLFLSLISFFASSQASAQTNTSDSLALVDLYNSTNGPNWPNHTNWLTSAPLSTWFGVFLDGAYVDIITLQHNNLVGSLPASLGNLTELPVTFNFSDNKLTGSIPNSFINLSGSAPSIFLLSRNQFSGPIPQFGGFWPPQRKRLRQHVGKWCRKQPVIHTDDIWRRILLDTQHGRGSGCSRGTVFNSLRAEEQSRSGYYLIERHARERHAMPFAIYEVSQEFQ